MTTTTHDAPAVDLTKSSSAEDGAGATPNPGLGAPAAGLGHTDIAGLYRLSVLVDALRDSSRFILKNRAPSEEFTSRRVEQFNRLRTTYIEILNAAGDTATTAWVPHAMSAHGSFIMDVYQNAADLAALVDSTMNTPGVVMAHRVATAQIGQAQMALDSRAVPPDAPQEDSSPAGAYL